MARQGTFLRVRRGWRRVAARAERQKKAGAKGGEEKRKGWWLKGESPIRKVRRDQRGLGPRLRVARRAVGAKARFRAQCAIPRYNRVKNGWSRTLFLLVSTIRHNVPVVLYGCYYRIIPCPSFPHRDTFWRAFCRLHGTQIVCHDTMTQCPSQQR